MAIKEIHLEWEMPEEEAEELAGTFLDENSYDILIEEDCNVYKPNGDLLLAYRKDVIPLKYCTDALESLRQAAVPTENRGLAGGRDPDSGKAGHPRYKLDGTISNTRMAHNTVRSGIVGFFDRYTRIPYCRTTAYNMNFPERFENCKPFFQEINKVFKEAVPQRWQNQQEVIGKTHPEWVIHGTVFTTITVNKNFQTAVHKDAGDLKEGFGVMTALKAGKFAGGYTVFPTFRVACNMDTRGVLLADVHEWHGNTKMRGIPNRFERLSMVFYYRGNMWKCGSSEHELERAKNRKLGDPLWDEEKILAEDSKSLLTQTANTEAVTGIEREELLDKIEEESPEANLQAG